MLRVNYNHSNNSNKNKNKCDKKNYSFSRQKGYDFYFHISEKVVRKTFLLIIFILTYILLPHFVPENQLPLFTATIESMALFITFSETK
jgi:uncharacterized membrane protein YkvA (DUF1232 family)